MGAIMTEIDWPDFDRPEEPIELATHYKVTIALPGGMLRVASWNLPLVRASDYPTGTTKITHVDADWIQDPDYGDTLGWIEWSSVQAITWRRVE
jgi:hypothetical protein